MTSQIAPALAQDALVVRLVSSLSGIAPEAWNACAAGREAAPGAPVPNPFLEHAFLLALEESGSATAATGWAGAHLVVEDAAGAVLGVAPSYLKSHSQGEYVFDHAFADAYLRAGGRYYPKIQVAVPFTPATGHRLLARPGPHATEARRALMEGLLGLMGAAKASSVHLTFLTEAEQSALTSAGLGFLPRLDLQYHWIDEGYGSFDGFLDAMSARKRKAVRRERREALGDGISVRWITGAELTEAHWDAFWAFYQDTGSRKWGRPYLTRRFFSRIGALMPERVLLIFAERGGRPIAGALNFIGADTLYGRYWGCVEDRPFLHFELCYHQAIDFALAHGLTRVEAGAQGEHKLARGYLPALTYSAHAFSNASLAGAVDGYLRQERREVLRLKEALAAESPFKAAR